MAGILALFAPRQRYLFRLVSLTVPAGVVASVRGLRMWSFVDGNIGWHIRKET
jgi:hypothetical protein